MKKRAWQFITLMGQGGTVIFPDPVDAEEALRECRLSLGPKLQKVY